METFDSQVALGCHKECRGQTPRDGADEGGVTPCVHPLSRDKDNIRLVLRGASNSVEAACSCADVRALGGKEMSLSGQTQAWPKHNTATARAEEQEGCC